MSAHIVISLLLDAFLIVTHRVDHHGSRRCGAESIDVISIHVCLR